MQPINGIRSIIENNAPSGQVQIGRGPALSPLPDQYGRNADGRAHGRDMFGQYAEVEPVQARRRSCKTREKAKGKVISSPTDLFGRDYSNSKRPAKDRLLRRLRPGSVKRQGVGSLISRSSGPSPRERPAGLRLCPGLRPLLSEHLLFDPLFPDKVEPGQDHQDGETDEGGIFP